MDELVMFLIIFVLVFIGRFLHFVISRKRKKKKKNTKKIDQYSIEITYISKKFKIQSNRLNKIWFGTLMSFVDGLIISLTVTTVCLITDNILLEMIIGLILMMVLIFLFYEIIGKILILKGFDKNEL